MRRVYLDLCALKRPFDDQSQPRIWLETQAVSLIMQSVDDTQIELATSQIVMLENNQNKWLLRREAVAKWTNLAAVMQEVTTEVEERAQALQGLGLRAVDALHLACAEASGSDVFVTCDDRIARRYQGDLRVLLPPECASELQEVYDADESTQ